MATTDPTTDAPARPVFTHVQVAGLLLMGAGPALSWVIEIGFLGTEALGLVPIFAPPIILSLVSAGLAWRFGSWAKALGVLVGLALLIMFGPFLIGSLTAVTSVFDFVPALMAVLGAVTAIVAGVAAIVRRTVLVVAPSPLERRIRTVGMVVLLALALLSGIATWLGVEQVDEEIRAGASEVTIAQFDFDPNPLEVSADEAARVVVRNADHVLHTFTVDELDVDVTVTPGSEGFVEFTAESGSYRIYCRPHSEPEAENADDAGMVAELEAS